MSLTPTTQNNTTPVDDPIAIIEQCYQALDSVRKEACRDRFRQVFNVSIRAFYKIVQGKKKQLTHKEAFFFAEYFDLEPKDLIPASEVALIKKLTRVKEKEPAYNSNPAGLTHMVVSKSRKK